MATGGPQLRTRPPSLSYIYSFGKTINFVVNKSSPARAAIMRNIARSLIKMYAARRPLRVFIIVAASSFVEVSYSGEVSFIVGRRGNSSLVNVDKESGDVSRPRP